MKKYAKPSVEIEKFTVADVITLSNPGEDVTEETNTDINFGELSAGLDVGDEF